MEVGLQRWAKPEIADMSSKTDRVCGTEKVLAQYPTINRLKTGELSAIQEPTNKKVKQGSEVSKNHGLQRKVNRSVEGVRR